MSRRAAVRCADAAGLFLILSLVRIPLIPYLIFAAFCGAMIAGRSRPAVRGPVHLKQGEKL